jgi:hypothetical protein
MCSVIYGLGKSAQIALTLLHAICSAYCQNQTWIGVGVWITTWNDTAYVFCKLFYNGWDQRYSN